VALDLGELNARISADDRGFSRTIDRVHKSLDGTGKRLGGLTGILGGIGKTTAFSAMATGIAGAASALGPLLSLVSTLGVAVVGLGAAIPAFAASGAAVIGTLTLAFQGMGDAIAGDEEALEKLPGPAREFAKTVSDLSDEWEHLQKAVQSKFFEGLSQTFSQTAKKVLPVLEDGLVGVADGLSEIAAAALDAADSPQFLKGMEDVLDSTSSALKTAAGGVEGFVRGFGILFSAFAPLIERAGLAFANLGQRFEEWITKADQAGRLQEIIQSMLDTLSTLGGIVQNIGSVLGSVFSAANETGGGLLGTIETLTGRLAEFFNSAKGSEALNSFFTALAQVGAAVVPIVLALAEAFGNDLAPHIATIATEVGPSLAALVAELGDAIGQIDVAALASGFADVLGAITPLIGPLGDFLGWVTSIEGLVPALVIALAAWTVAQWALNAALTANPIGVVIMAIAALVAAIVLLVANWDSVVASLKYSWDMVVEGFMMAFNAIADFFMEWWPWIFAIATGGLSLIVDFIIDHWDQIKQVTSDVFSAIGDFFVFIWDWIVAQVQAGVSGVLAVIGWFRDLPGKVGGWFQGVYNAAKDKLNSLVNWVKDIPGKITGALGSLKDLLFNAGKDILQGLIDGIESMWNSVQDKLGDLTSSLPDWKGPEAVDKKLLFKPGTWVIGGLIDGLDSMIPQVERTLSGLTTDIGLSVDGAAAPASSGLRVDATASLSDEDRALLRELAEARARVDVRLGANLTAATTRENAMGVA
jgi:phage-related protein